MISHRSSSEGSRKLLLCNAKKFTNQRSAVNSKLLCVANLVLIAHENRSMNKCSMINELRSTFRGGRMLATLALFVYAAGMLWLTLVFVPADHPRPNVIPFRSMAHDWRAGGRDFVVNFLGNILAFIPMGVLLTLAFARPVRARQVFFLIGGFSGAIEVMQYASGLRVGDVDDVLLNALGGLIGYGLVLVARRLARRRWCQPS